MLLRAAAAALSLLTAPVAAQTTLQPGMDSLAAAPPQNVEYAVRLVHPVVQDIGTIVVTETVDGDRLHFTSHALIPMAGADQSDSTVVAWPSLAPVYRIRTEPDASSELTFSGDRAVGTDVEDGEVRELDIALSEADFGPGIGQRIARSLPFEEGLTAHYDQISDDGGRKTIELKVTEQQTFPFKGTDRTVWVVRETEPGQPTLTLRVDAETRELLQLEFAPQRGARVLMTAK